LKHGASAGVQIGFNSSKINLSVESGMLKFKDAGSFSTKTTLSSNNDKIVNSPSQTSVDYIPASNQNGIDLSIVNVGRAKGEPKMTDNVNSVKYGKYPEGIKYENINANPNIVVPNEDSGFGTKKVIKMYYGNNTTSYFNYLAETQITGYGDRKIYGNIYESTQKGMYFKYFYNTLEINFDNPEFYVSFDVIKTMPNNITLSELVTGKYIENLQFFTNKNIK
jgi:hypothetical protein